MSRADDWLFGRWGPVEKQLINWAKDVLWPEGALCCACGRVSGGEALCPACRESLLYDGSVFAWVRNDPEPGLPAWSLRAHEGVARQLVLRLKYGAEARAARLLSEILLPLPEDVSFPPDTVVTWVTMPESRRRDRFIDHGRLLAENFAEKLGLPCRRLLLRGRCPYHRHHPLPLRRGAARRRGGAGFRSHRHRPKIN